MSSPFGHAPQITSLPESATPPVEAKVPLTVDQQHALKNGYPPSNPPAPAAPPKDEYSVPGGRLGQTFIRKDF